MLLSIHKAGWKESEPLGLIASQTFSDSHDLKQTLDQTCWITILMLSCRIFWQTWRMEGDPGLKAAKHAQSWCPLHLASAVPWYLDVNCALLVHDLLPYVHMSSSRTSVWKTPKHACTTDVFKPVAARHGLFFTSLRILCCTFKVIFKEVEQN